MVFFIMKGNRCWKPFKANLFLSYLMHKRTFYEIPLASQTKFHWKHFSWKTFFLKLDHTKGGGARNTKRGSDFSSEFKPEALFFCKISEEVFCLSAENLSGLKRMFSDWGNTGSDSDSEKGWIFEFESGGDRERNFEINKYFLRRSMSKCLNIIWNGTG